MICYQTQDGVFVGLATADPDPLTPGQYLYPGGCVAFAPPAFSAQERARFANGGWVVEPLPEPLVTSDNLGVLASWDGAKLSIQTAAKPALTAGQTATWNGTIWSVTNAPTPVPPPPSILAQDLMAQLTATDLQTIQTAISGNPNYLLLWYSMLAQRDPMLLSNARFVAGWAGLVAILGQTRMNAIATALGAAPLVVAS
jgi:hypothetical protein